MDLLMGFYREFRGAVDLTYISDVWLPEVQYAFTFLTPELDIVVRMRDCSHCIE